MNSFNLEIVRDAFIACVVYPKGTTNVQDSSDDEFEDALSDVEVAEECLQASGLSSPLNNISGARNSMCYNEDFINAIEYANGFYEIAKFFKFLNMTFTFVAKNLESSCEYITTVAKLHNQDIPVSLEQTLEYDEKVEHKYGIISCVLWLHRPLEFIIMLFRELANAPGEEPTSEIAKRCYAATLGRHHAWPIQQMVNVLLLTLPQRYEVVQMMNLSDEEVAKSLLLEVSVKGQAVYERVERMIQRLDLSD